MTKLYLHNAAKDTAGGTYPSGEQSASAADVTWGDANTLRTMNTTIGTAQQSLSVTSLGQTATQKHFCGFFCTDPFDVGQTVGGGTWTFNAAQVESATNMNFGIDGIHAYVWRPSTGAKVGSCIDTTLDLISAINAETGIAEAVITFTFSTAGVSALAGDVLIVEVWTTFTQTTTATRTGSMYFDGTTENNTLAAAASNHAAYVETAENLTFSAGGGGGGPVMPVFRHHYQQQRAA